MGFSDIPARPLLPGGFMSVTSDKLSTKIVNLRDSIGSSDVLWGNQALRNKVRGGRLLLPRTSN